MNFTFCGSFILFLSQILYNDVPESKLEYLSIKGCLLRTDSGNSGPGPWTDEKRNKDTTCPTTLVYVAIYLTSYFILGLTVI